MTTAVMDAMQIAIDSCRSIKEDCARDATDYLDSIMATGLQMYRGNEPVALVIIQPDRDTMLDVAAVCASGFGADVIALIFESHYSFLPENPETGLPWMSGELQQAAREGKDGISNALVVHVTNRAGDAAVTMLPYEIEGSEVHWGESVESLPGAPPEAGRFSGALSDAMSKIMLEEVPLQVKFQRSGMQPFHETFGDPPETEVDHLDCITVKYLSTSDDVISAALYASQDSLREGIINKVLPGGMSQI